MAIKTEMLISFLKSNGGVGRFSVILKAGFHPDSLAVLEAEGKVEKIGRGIYRLAGFQSDSYSDFVIATLQAPRGVVCLISALAFHEATDEIPRQVDLAIPRRTRANRIKYPPVRFYQFSPATWELGIEKHKIEGHEVRVYSLAKTIADCFRFRNRIGMDVVRNALKVAIIEKKVKPQEILRYAKACRVDTLMKPILEAML